MTRLSLDAVELEPGSRYEARLRVRMAAPEPEVEEELRYEGLWSEWSQSARFPSPQSPARGAALPPALSPSWSPAGGGPAPAGCLPTFSGILKEGHTCPGQASWNLSLLCHGRDCGPGGHAGLCFCLRSQSWSHLSREGWADPGDLLGRVPDPDDLAEAEVGALRG